MYLCMNFCNYTEIYYVKLWLKTFTTFSLTHLANIFWATIMFRLYDVQTLWYIRSTKLNQFLPSERRDIQNLCIQRNLLGEDGSWSKLLEPITDKNKGMRLWGHKYSWWWHYPSANFELKSAYLLQQTLTQKCMQTKEAGPKPSILMFLCSLTQMITSQKGWKIGQCNKTSSTNTKMLLFSSLKHVLFCF